MMLYPYFKKIDAVTSPLFVDLLGQIILDTDLVDLVKLGLYPVGTLYFFLQDRLKK